MSNIITQGYGSGSLILQGYGGGVIPPLPSDGPTLFAAIRNYLLSLPTLSPLTGIYKNKPARGATYPYMLISMISGVPDINNSDTYPDDTEYQFSTLSSDDIQAETIGEYAFTALMPKAFRHLRFDDGYEIVRLPLYHNRLIEQERGPKNVNQWMHTFGYCMQTGRSMIP